jgi:DNA-directed RNA polymerase specialized sigma24 family protein
MERKSESDDIDPKVVADVYQAIMIDFRKAAYAQGKQREDAEDVCNEAIARMLESHQKASIKNPLHWARHTAANLWRDVGRRDRKHVSYDGVEGVSRDQGTWRIWEGEDKGQDLITREPFEKGKVHPGHHVKAQMAEAVMDDRSPELITEQRDFIQKIDAEWRQHMEEGYDFGSGKKMDRNTRRQIQRRARALLKEGPLCLQSRQSC